MSNSIEKIWKEGFLNEDKMVAPKVNDLYNQKSFNLVDGFERKYRINIIALAVGAPVLAAILTLTGQPILAAYIGIGLILHAAMGRRYQIQLSKIDKTANSYEYLKSFKTWLDNSTKEMSLISRIFYPLMVLAFSVQMRLLDIFSGEITGGVFAHLLATPGWMILATAVLMVVFFLAGPALYRLDLKTVYGKDIKHLDEVLTDMETLKK